MNAYDILKQRGFLYQLTDESEIQGKLTSNNVTFYVGIDPTGDSLHVGHLLPLMAARWLQSFGHQPIILIGGGTALIGDPSGKTEVRQILDRDEIETNAAALKDQLARFIAFNR